MINWILCFFLHTQDEWSREQLEFILLRGRDHFVIARAYCSLALLFDSLLSSSPSTSSVPSLPFRSLAAWYQVWLILLGKIHSDQVPMDCGQVTSLCLPERELMPALFFSENRWSLFPVFSFLKKPISCFSPPVGLTDVIAALFRNFQWSYPCHEPFVLVSDFIVLSDLKGAVTKAGNGCDNSEFMQLVNPVRWEIWGTLQCYNNQITCVWGKWSSFLLRRPLGFSCFALFCGL